MSRTKFPDQSKLTVLHQEPPRDFEGPDDDPGYEESVYCDCGALHDGLEDDGRCEACGKII